MLVEGHIRLDRNLDNLVYHDDGQEDGEGDEGTFLHCISGINKMGNKGRLAALQGQRMTLLPNGNNYF